MNAKDFAKIYNRDADLISKNGKIALKDEVNASISSFLSSVIHKKLPNEIMYEAGNAIKVLVELDSKINIESIQISAFMSRESGGPRVDIVFRIKGTSYNLTPNQNVINLPHIEDIIGMHNKICWVVDARSPFFDVKIASAICSYTLAQFMVKSAVNNTAFIMALSDDLKGLMG